MKEDEQLHISEPSRRRKLCASRSVTGHLAETRRCCVALLLRRRLPQYQIQARYSSYVMLAAPICRWASLWRCVWCQALAWALEGVRVMPLPWMSLDHSRCPSGTPLALACGHLQAAHLEAVLGRAAREGRHPGMVRRMA